MRNHLSYFCVKTKTIHNQTENILIGCLIPYHSPTHFKREKLLLTTISKTKEILFMRKIPNKITDLQKTDNPTNTSTQTPIEIALQIDENGMTTASNLYAFLELDITHFSRWCNKKHYQK